jgi:putative FmdB family regulatory protein
LTTPRRFLTGKGGGIMPLYELTCDCGHSVEMFLKLADKEPVCDKCGLRMKKSMSAPAFVLKGRNWAKDNYGLKEGKKKK